MATAHKKGAADIVYTPVGGTEIVHTLALPLQINPQHGFSHRARRRFFQAWNSAGDDREVFVIGGATDDITAKIRMEDDPAGLRALLKEGLHNNVTLTYRPDGATEYPCLLVSVEGGEPGQVTLNPDRDRYAYGEYEATVVLRRVDGGDFEGLL